MNETPLVEFVGDNHVNLKNAKGSWVGGWWVPVENSEARKQILQAIRAAYLLGKSDRSYELRQLINHGSPEYREGTEK